MATFTVPSPCPGCGCEAIAIPSAYPPRVQCTACSFSTSGATYLDAYKDWQRRGGAPGHVLRCSWCGRETSDHFDQVGGECFYCSSGHYMRASAAGASCFDGNSASSHGTQASTAPAAVNEERG